ncbi:hypothetical protein F5I97DRAFT_1930809 [Phlebopus sp. FC_14]|nr:hypothetical protein F5I97DRAFT_1930809 [Phlebopus sp. FC_14]
MAVRFRPQRLSNQWSLWCCTFTLFANSAIRGVVADLNTSTDRQYLQDPNVIFVNQDGTILVYSVKTGQEIAQGPASDGSSNSVIWMIFLFIVGAPLLFAGIRGWRLTTGAAIGLAAALTSWAVIVNNLNNAGIPDIAITISVLALFASGFLLGLFEIARLASILILGILGGLALGIRIVLLRSGLLISDQSIFFVNWLLIGIFGLACGILVVWKQRIGLLNGCASCGSFMCALGFDLAMNQQSGMSRGLRCLFDRNAYHIVDIYVNGYSPPLVTIIILAISIAATPAFAFAQWKLFKRPFGGVRSEELGTLPVPEELDIPAFEKAPSHNETTG